MTGLREVPEPPPFRPLEPYLLIPQAVPDLSRVGVFTRHVPNTYRWEFDLAEDEDMLMARLGIVRTIHRLGGWATEAPAHDLITLSSVVEWRGSVTEGKFDPDALNGRERFEDLILHQRGPDQADRSTIGSLRLKRSELTPLELSYRMIAFGGLIAGRYGARVTLSDIRVQNSVKKQRAQASARAAQDSRPALRLIQGA